MIGIAGAGAFGTALAVALAADGRHVRLWARDLGQVKEMRQTRRNDSRLKGVALPQSVEVVDDVAALGETRVVLLAVPAQAMRGFLQADGAELLDLPLVACNKGIDLTTLHGPSRVMRDCGASGPVAVLTGPSFAADIARGLPTALTLACADPVAADLQRTLSTATLRLYRTDDVIGAELGGALKNVIAIASGVVIGAGLGESARAALITRGYAEILRFAMHLGARAETLAGLSGLGDLILTCTSPQSRNFLHGLALGARTVPQRVTVEGIATAQAVVRLSQDAKIEMPISSMVAQLVTDRIGVEEAIRTLMSRPLKQE